MTNTPVEIEISAASGRAHAHMAGAGAVLAAAALWGTVGPAQVLASSPADPGALGVARLLLGGLVLAVFCPKPAAWRQTLRRPVIGWVLLAALATGVYQITFMHAVDQLGAALGTAIALGVAPAATGLCARWWTRERLSLGWVGGTLAAVIGCAVLLNPWAAARPSITGIGIALVSGTCYGIYTVAAKRFLQAGLPALPATTITLIIAGVVLAPFLVLHPEHLTDTSSLLLIAWIALAGTAAAYAAFIYGLPELDLLGYIRGGEHHRPGRIQLIVATLMDFLRLAGWQKAARASGRRARRGVCG